MALRSTGARGSGALAVRATTGSPCCGVTTWTWRSPLPSGVRGIGTALAEAALAEAPRDVTAWSHADHPAAAALARRFGFKATRSLWVMSREAGPVEVPDVEGVTIRGYRDSDAERGAPGERRGVRPPPRAGFDGRLEPRRPDGRAVVRPRGAAGRRRRATSCSPSTGPSSTPTSSARCTSSRSTRPPRDGVSDGR